MEELLLSANELHCINDVRQIQMYADEPLVTETSYIKVEIAIKNLKDINHQISIKIRQN
jgi:hypothetical protein